MRDNRSGAEITVQSMLNALDRRHCILHMWTIMKDDTAENKKYISSVLDSFSIPNFYIRKRPATRSQVAGESWLQRVPHGKSTSKEMPQKEI